MTDWSASLRVPAKPPAPSGCYMPLAWWVQQVWLPDRVKVLRLHINMVRSAHTFGALLGAPMGPRGGVYYAVESVESWKKWRAVWLARIRGRMAAEARRALEPAR